jgi:hypothetical protein
MQRRTGLCKNTRMSVSPDRITERFEIAQARSDGDLLRRCVIAAGVGWAVLFTVVGLTYQLQLYGDGSIFSYSVAADDVWAFHWHNISGRLTTYVLSLLPGELYVGFTHDAAGGIFVYGLLFFAAQVAGLGATYWADRSHGRVLFTFGCASTACFCPLVFGFPTEMWIAHALFWPALALCHYGWGDKCGLVLIFATLLALVFAHAAAVVMAIAILTTVALRRLRSDVFLRTAAALLVVFAIWVAVKILFPPDAYFAGVLGRAATHFFDLARLYNPLLVLFAATLVGYGVLFVLLQRFAPERAHIVSVVIVTAGLAIYWLVFDQALHTYYRYFMRTVLFLGALSLGTLAALYALRDEGALKLPVPHLDDIMTFLTRDVVLRLTGGAIVLVTLVHAVETAKFVAAWSDYKIALRTLANGTAADSTLGDSRFVSANRIAADLNRVSWNSTTPYLSVLVAPKFAPARLVVDPAGYYFWLTCQTARANETAARAIPQESRRLIRVLACAHRPR